jgi:hypothetical protein
VSYCKCGEESIGECVVCSRPVCGYHSAFFDGLRVCDDDRTEAKHDPNTEQQHARLAASAVTYVGFERAMAGATTLAELQRHVGMERDAATFWAAVRRVLHDTGVAPDVELCELSVRVTAGVLSKAFSTAQFSVDERTPAWLLPPAADRPDAAPVVLGEHAGAWRVDPDAGPVVVSGDRTAQHRFAAVVTPGERLKLARVRDRGSGGKRWAIPGRAASGGAIGSSGLDLPRAGAARDLRDALLGPRAPA